MGRQKGNCEFGFGVGERKMPLNYRGAEVEWRDGRKALTDINA